MLTSASRKGPQAGLWVLTHQYDALHHTARSPGGSPASALATSSGTRMSVASAANQARPTSRRMSQPAGAALGGRSARREACGSSDQGAGEQVRLGCAAPPPNACATHQWSCWAGRRAPSRWRRPPAARQRRKRSSAWRRAAAAGGGGSDDSGARRPSLLFWISHGRSRPSALAQLLAHTNARYASALVEALQRFRC